MTPASGEGDGLRGMRRAVFETTAWAVVLNAGHSSAPGADSALAKLCQDYWLPLYAFLRRSGYSPHDAQELTQEFFARLLEKKQLRLADPARGKFRSFLLGTLKHFLSDERKRANAQKRGGGRELLSLDAAFAEEQYRVEPADDLTPDKIYDRRWAMMLLERAVARLRQEYADAGKSDLFEGLRQFQSGEQAESTYAETAVRVGLSVSAIKTAIHRMRNRHRELLRDEVAQTVSTIGDVDDEIRHLIGVLSS